MNKCVDSEQIDSYNELEQMLKERCISDDMADALRMFAQAAVDTADTLKRFAELCSTQIEEGKEIAINIRTKKEALQELSGIKTNKQKVKHIKVQTKQKEVTECTYQSLHADLLLVFC